MTLLLVSKLLVMYENLPHRNCLLCKKIIRGRSDKKFCNDNCRNQFNNTQRPASNSYVKGINQALFRNRNILDSILPPAVPAVKANRDTLIEKGFQFRFYTHQSKADKGSSYVFCYDLGYQMIDTDHCIIIRQEASD
jgi:predicted nucleic acid-binding Zn ribbon protein